MCVFPIKKATIVDNFLNYKINKNERVSYKNLKIKFLYHVGKSVKQEKLYTYKKLNLAIIKQYRDE